MASYNYDAFSSKDYDFNTSTGPHVGDKAPDFTVSTSAGEPRRLLDFKGDFLVLEMGSITCPLFQSRRKIMSTLDVESERVDSVVLYVREAHPGAQIPSHKDVGAKRACATRLQQVDGETRTVLVDDMDGTAHKAYGEMPNAVFIINRNGCIVFRAEWNNSSATRKALEALIEGRPVLTKSYCRPPVPTRAIRTFRGAGKGSALDFFKSLPALIWSNLIKRNLRLMFNRPQSATRDMTC